MRFWIVVWSFVTSIITYACVDFYQAGEKNYIVLSGALLLLAIYMWLYTFIRIIIIDFAPLIINFCRIKLPIIEQELKEKDKNNGDES
jgi:hypothetical protein